MSVQVCPSRHREYTDTDIQEKLRPLSASGRQIPFGRGIRLIDCPVNWPSAEIDIDDVTDGPVANSLIDCVGNRICQIRV